MEGGVGGRFDPMQQGVLNVRILSCRTALLAALTIWCASALPAWGQGPARPVAPARPAGTSVAVIDLQEVFKNHARLKMAMEDIKKDTEALNARMRAEQKKLEKMVLELKELRPGTIDYKTREEEIAHVDSNVRVQLQLERKGLREREVKLYFNAYEEVVGAVERFAQDNGIALVIRFNAEEIDPSNPESIMAGLNRHVVYQRNLNITEFVLAEINAGVKPRPVDPGVSGLPPDRTGNKPLIPRR
jgi:Skp family chaperone for outer membrane proteins